MSKRILYCAGIALAACMTLGLSDAAQARHWGFGWGPYLYYGWPYDRFSFSFPQPDRYPPHYYNPAPECGWVRVQTRRKGHQYWRRVRRCW